MGSSFEKIDLSEITQEKIEELYRFLQGELPKGIHIKHPPKLSSRKAFRVIWFLQEVTGVLPDRYERCKTCGDIFDSYDGVGKAEHCYAHDYLD